MEWMVSDIGAGLWRLVEIGVPALALYAHFRQRGQTLAEAAAYGLFIPLMLLSGLSQLALMARVPGWIWGLEIVMVLGAGAMLRHQDFRLRRLGQELLGFGRTHPLATLSLGAAGLWLGGQAILGAQVLPEPALSTQLLDNLIQGRSLDSLAAAGLRPDNAQWLTFLNLRLDTPAGAGLHSFWAYLATGLATYALARRYAWPPTAITVTLVVMSMPRLVALAPSGRPEVIQAAAAAVSLLALYRVVERPSPLDVVVLTSATTFSLGGPGVAPALPVVLGGLCLVLILRRHDYRTLWPALKAQPYLLAVAVAVMILFSQLPAARYAVPWVSAQRNADGLVGSLANLGRYGLESLDFTRPVEQLGLALGGESPRAVLEQLHGRILAGPLGMKGAKSKFEINWSASLPAAWFGPLSVLFILPAIGYALVKGPRRLKAVCVALLAYLYLITLIPAWQPGNAYLFTPFFTLGGCCSAFFLPPWRFSRRRLRGLQLLCAGLLLYGCLLNSIPPESALGNLFQ